MLVRLMNFDKVKISDKNYNCDKMDLMLTFDGLGKIARVPTF